MSGPVDGVYRIRFVDLDNLPPPLGGEFATSAEEGKPVITAPSSPPYFGRQRVCS
jgi:hypothetical protein